MKLICWLFHASFLTRIVTGPCYTIGALTSWTRSCTEYIRWERERGAANDLGRLRIRLPVVGYEHFLKSPIDGRQISSELVNGVAGGFVQGCLDFTACLWMFSHSACFLLRDSSFWAFSQPTCCPFLHGKYVVSIVCFTVFCWQCVVVAALRVVKTLSICEFANNICYPVIG